VDRDTRCFLAWDVLGERNLETLQPLVLQAARAGRRPAGPNLIGLEDWAGGGPARWYSDGMDAYPELLYPAGEHAVDKKETYSVEAGNAELRHYLARLGRKSRCFSRCPEALKRAVFLFVHAWNTRQLRRREHPSYPAHLPDCLPILS
jgi:insertion element IS1 protein InsB